ncbi:GTPase HflX [Candidatus Obscuribacterales bacterium]|nr:GTPase HflX [Candidatus Obscuribacterales bacterium]
MHGKLDLANAKGLKKSEIHQLERLLTKRIPKEKVLTLELADSVAEISHEIGSSISVVINRRGQVVNVTAGPPSAVNMPELRGVRVGPGRFCGHRIIFTQLNSDTLKLAKKKALTVANGEGTASDTNRDEPSVFTKDSLQCLAKNRLDLLAQIDVDPNGQFSRSRGEQTKMADAVHIAHLMPGRDSQGRLWKVLEPQTARGAGEDNFDDLINSLEDEFREQAPGLQVAEGEERAVLVGLINGQSDSWQVEDDLDELAQLARTAGATICGRITQARQQPHPKHFLGSGKVQEVALMAQELGANLVIIDQELSPTQQRNLEDMVGVKVLDRTELILDIFSQRAQTKEGKLQVELAQLKYLYPRLVGKGLLLSRLGGGIGTRGPGETKLEVDRRRIRSRINHLEKETERISSYRDTQRRQRVTQNLPVVALVGYTNSGKSTLLNALTKSDVFVENKLFATLDPTTRKTSLPDGSTVLISDTVGFIKKLPTTLVAAFRATLEETQTADVLLHVVDSSHPNVLEQIVSVFDVLAELGAVDKPLITVLNKADKVRPEDLAWLAAQVPGPIITSATSRVGFGNLLSQVQELLAEVRPDRQRSSA